MKKDRLLEIIREEIVGALSEVSNALVTNKKGETTPIPFNTPDEKSSVMNLKKDSNITNIETTDGKNIKEEEQLDEMAKITEPIRKGIEVAVDRMVKQK